MTKGAFAPFFYIKTHHIRQEKNGCPTLKLFNKMELAIKGVLVHITSIGGDDRNSECFGENNMPRGVPSAGFRMTKNRKMMTFNTDAYVRTNLFKVNTPVVIEDHKIETDEEIYARIAERFEVLEYMTDAAITGDARAVIVSGPAGLGKSHTVESKLAAWGKEDTNYRIVKGYVRATGLFKLLYQNRMKGQVLVFDDTDYIFKDETALGLLKAVCDSGKRRIVSYMTEGVMIDDETAERIPKQFEFNGTIIFISNKDFDEMIARGHAMSPHLEAMVSRAHYIDLAMKTARDYMIRIKQVCDEGLLDDCGLDNEGKDDVMLFLETYQDRLREISLRMAKKIADIRRVNPVNWERVARITCCVNQ